MTKPYDDEETLREHFIDKRMTQQEIADKFGVSDSTISRRLRKFGIKELHKQRSVLHELHHDRKMSLQEMADELEVAPSTIHFQMEENGVEKRTRSKGRKLAALKRAPSMRTDDEGYEVITITDGSGKTITAVGQHRLLAIAKHGLESVKDKEIHHSNGIPWDNRPENLEIMTDSEHREQHWKEGLYDEQRGDS